MCKTDRREYPKYALCSAQHLATKLVRQVNDVVACSYDKTRSLWHHFTCQAAAAAAEIDIN